MHVRNLRILALTGLAALGACGDDDGVANVGVSDLSDTEVAALGEAVAGTVVAVWEEDPQIGPAAASGPQLALITFEEMLSLTASCDFGGSVAVDGDVFVQFDDVTEEGTIEYTVTQVHQGCRAESEEDDIVFTLDGAPSVTSELSVSVLPGSFEFDGSVIGGIDWSTDSREGTCSVDLSFSMELDAVTETGSAQMSGSICGVTISRSLSVT